MTTHTLDYFFEKYHFSDRDRFDTLQIFSLLSKEKQTNFVSNFDKYAMDVQQVNSDMEIEKNILIDDAVEQVKQALLKNRKQKLKEEIQQNN